MFARKDWRLAYLCIGTANRGEIGCLDIRRNPAPHKSPKATHTRACCCDKSGTHKGVLWCGVVRANRWIMCMGAPSPQDLPSRCPPANRGEIGCKMKTRIGRRISPTTLEQSCVVPQTVYLFHRQPLNFHKLFICSIDSSRKPQGCPFYSCLSLAHAAAAAFTYESSTDNPFPNL